jgi:hypothetical protein
MNQTTSNTAVLTVVEKEVTTERVPDRISMAVSELRRLATEAVDYFSNGELFPGLSTLTGLTPVIGLLRDYCVSRVVHQQEEGSDEHITTSDPKSGNVHPGIYL